MTKFDRSKIELHDVVQVKTQTGWEDYSSIHNIGDAAMAEVMVREHDDYRVFRPGFRRDDPQGIVLDHEAAVQARVEALLANLV